MEIHDEKVRQDAVAVLQKAETLAVFDTESMARANEFLREATAAEKRVEAFFAPMKKATRAAWVEVCDREKEVLAPIRSGKEIAARNIGKFVDEQERIRIEEENRLRREAEERARLEREEAQRLAREAEAEALRRAESAQMEKAAELARSGEAEAAAELLSQPVVDFVAPEDQRIVAGMKSDAVPVYAPPPSAGPSVKENLVGSAVVKTWKFEVFDLRALLRGVLDGKVPIMAVQANETYIGSRARSDKELFDMPGVKVWAESKARSTGR